MLEIIKTTFRGMIILLAASVTFSIPVAILTYMLHVGNGLYLAILLGLCLFLFMCYQLGTDFQERKEPRSTRPPK